VPATLEMLGIPCTGSDAVAIGITLDKALAKLLAKAHGIPTAPWRPAAGGGGAPLRFPLFVKPAAEGSSMGVTAKSFCRDETELHAAVERVRAYGPVLIEEFLPGNEYTVGVLAGKVIAVMQVVPKIDKENFFYSIEVKRDYERRVEYTIVEEPRVAKVALDIWQAFGLRDVARVDVRCDRDGVPNFVEVNPLPGVHPVHSDLVILAEKAGWTYDELIGGIMTSAEERWRA